MSDREQVLLERAYVLHQRAYRNSSQLLECLTERHGRIGLVAQGSRRAPGGGGRASGRGQRALLQSFLPLRVSWTRRGDLGRLIHVEADGAAPELAPQALLAAFYVNELLLRLVARGDPNDTVFSCYSACLSDLAGSPNVARPLRLFELRFLRALGYGLELDVDIENGEPLRPDGRYTYEAELGPRAVAGHAANRVAEPAGHRDAEHACDRVAEPGPDVRRRTANDAGEDRLYWGRDLIALRREALDDEASLNAAKRLLGRVLREHLGDRPLKSRSVLKDIVARGL